MEISESGGDAAAEGRAKKLVAVELNGSTLRIERGQYTGRELKLALGVPSEHELDEVIKGEFRPVANDKKVHIQGGEKFVSHCGQGQSS
jgi:hypothetical protein